MRKTASVLVVAGTVCSLAIIALLNSNSASSNTFLMKMHDRESDFVEWVSTYRRMYGTKAEYEFRRDIFIKNLEMIEDHNANEESYKLRMNKFGDFTLEEYKRLLGR